MNRISLLYTIWITDTPDISPLSIYSHKLWQKKWKWDRYFSEHFGVTLPLWFHLCAIIFDSCTTNSICGPGSVVGITTGYGLDSLRIESQWGRDFPYLFRPALGSHPASLTMGTGSFPGVKSVWGVTLTPQPLLVPWSRKSRTIPLLPLGAVRPVQSLSACTRVHFTFTFYWLYTILVIDNVVSQHTFNTHVYRGISNSCN